MNKAKVLLKGSKEILLYLLISLVVIGIGIVLTLVLKAAGSAFVSSLR